MKVTEAPGIVSRRTEHTEVTGRYKNAVYPYPGYCDRGRTELTEVPGTGIRV